jgi:aspartate racemase
VQTQDGHYPPLLINSIDMTRMLDLVAANRLAELTEYLLREIDKLARAGAEFGLLASNTPHLVFDDLRRGSPIPLLSIVEAAAEAVAARRLRTVGLLGTRFTMEGRFYPEVFAKREVTVLTPVPDERRYVHDIYMGELAQGEFRPDTRDRIVAIMRGMAQRDGVEGVLLAGTELPLLLRGTEAGGVPLLDTTQIHVARALDVMLERAA